MGCACAIEDDERPRQWRHVHWRTAGAALWRKDAQRPAIFLHVPVIVREIEKQRQ